MKKNLAYIFPGLFAVAFVSLVLVGNLGPSAACSEKKDFEGFNYTGIVNEKFNDKTNHNVRTLVFSVNQKLFNMILVDDTSGYYEYVKVGDTIIKLKNSDYIKVNHMKKFKIYFNCNK
jgi:spermidine/putrescine-binding protein